MAVTVNVRRLRIEKEYSTIKGVYQVNGGITLHREAATLLGDVDITDRAVNIEFGSPFNEFPFGWVEVYRMRSTSTGWVKSNVLIKYPSEDWVTVNGFSLTIDPSESLTGVVLKYYFIE